MLASADGIDGMSEFASELVRLMDERGTGVRELAGVIHVSHGHLSNLRTGRKLPSPELAEELGRYLGVGLALREAYDRDRSSAPGAALARNGDGARQEASQRLEYALKNPGSADLITAASLRQELQQLDEQYVRVPAAALLAPAGQYLGQARLLAGHASRGAVQRELRSVGASAAVLMGQLVWDASYRRDHASARVWLDQAAETARQVRDPVLEGLALLRSCMIALYGEGDPRGGLALAERSARVARRSSESVTGLALLHAAEAYAMLGERLSCETALAAAERQFARVGDMDAAAVLYSEAHLERMAGSCYLALGNARRAQGLLEAAAKSADDGSKPQAVVLGNLALAHIRQGDPSAAAEMLHQAIDVIELTWGGGGMTLVFEAGRELRHWAGVPVVGEVRDRMLALLAR